MSLPPGKEGSSCSENPPEVFGNSLFLSVLSIPVGWFSIQAHSKGAPSPPQRRSGVNCVYCGAVFHSPSHSEVFRHPDLIACKKQRVPMGKEEQSNSQEASVGEGFSWEWHLQTCQRLRTACFPTAVQHKGKHRPSADRSRAGWEDSLHQNEGQARSGSAQKMLAIQPVNTDVKPSAYNNKYLNRTSGPNTRALLKKKKKIICSPSALPPSLPSKGRWPSAARPEG